MSQTIQISFTNLPVIPDPITLPNGWYYHKNQTLLKIANGEFIRMRVSRNQAIFEEYPFKISSDELSKLTVLSTMPNAITPLSLVNKNYSIVTYDTNSPAMALRVFDNFYSLTSGELLDIYVPGIYDKVTSFTINFRFETCDSTEPPVVSYGFLVGQGYVESQTPGQIVGSQVFNYNGTHVLDSGVQNINIPGWYADVPVEDRSNVYDIDIYLDDRTMDDNTQTLCLLIGDNPTIANLFSGLDRTIGIFFGATAEHWQFVINIPTETEEQYETEIFNVSKNSVLNLYLIANTLYVLYDNTVDTYPLPAFIFQELTQNIFVFAGASSPYTVPPLEIRVLNQPRTPL